MPNTDHAAHVNRFAWDCTCGAGAPLFIREAPSRYAAEQHATHCPHGGTVTVTEGL